jgi:hypothetical protein
MSTFKTKHFAMDRKELNKKISAPIIDIHLSTKSLACDTAYSTQEPNYANYANADIRMSLPS